MSDVNIDWKFTSNENKQDVFFDNVVLAVNSGPLLEETYYYPFGLTMSGISYQALNGETENRYKYNKGSELQSREFSDGSGLELYATYFRSLDPQLRRFWQVDQKPDVSITPYAAMGNNPILNNDPLGDTIKRHTDYDYTKTANPVTRDDLGGTNREIIITPSDPGDPNKRYKMNVEVNMIVHDNSEFLRPRGV